MRAVDEEDVTGPQLLEASEIDVLDLLGDELRDAVDSIQQEPARVWLDACEPHAPVQVLAVHLGGDQRREARSDLDHRRGRQITQHAFEDPGVERRKLPVAGEVHAVLGISVGTQHEPFLAPRTSRRNARCASGFQSIPGWSSDTADHMRERVAPTSSRASFIAEWS